jgi:Zn-dependent protease with chaperone function
MWYHATHHVGILSLDRGPTARALLYGGPLAIGMILVVFMIKPLFARQGRRAEQFSVGQADEPLLFAFIARICGLVNAPLPSRVDVDCQVNASASFRRGVWSLAGNDVVLTIGLPLAAGLSARELAGVLAHEFGHFAQGAGMRLTYIIRQINFWFSRVVYERDRWDDQLTHWAKQGDWRLGLVLQVARFCVWLTRRILWVLMTIGHALSCFMLRQMEYDADSYEVKVAGSDAFNRTMERLQVLGLAAQGASQDIQETWKNRRLPDDLPALVLHRAGALPSSVREAVQQSLHGKKTGIFDTHPADCERINAAQAAASPGVFHWDGPASALFRDFATLSRAVTRRQFQEDWMEPLKEENFVAVQEAVRISQTQGQAAQAAERFLAGWAPGHPPILVGDEAPGPSADLAALLAQLRDARARMEGGRSAAEQTHQRFGEADSRLLDFTNALHLLQTGFRIKPKEFHLPKSSIEAAEKALTEVRQELQQLTDELAPYGASARTWLATALRLLHAPEIAAKLEQGAALQQQARELAPVLSRLGQVLEPLNQVRLKFSAVAVLLANRESSSKTKEVDECIRSLTGELQQTLADIHARLAGLPYPFRHARGRISLSDYIRDEGAHSTELERLGGQCSVGLDRVFGLYHCVLGCMVLIAEHVEARMLGKARLPQA